MRALLDVNVLIALLDPDHAFHSIGHNWWSANHEAGWASCPITENGVVRVLSQPGYSAKTQFTPATIISKLQAFVERTDHQFWPDEISLRESAHFHSERIHSSRHITDAYLLALAVQNGGRLATFDVSIAINAISAATSSSLCIIK